MGSMMLAVELNWIGKLIYQYLYSWVNGWVSSNDIIGAFAVTVILFTIFLKTLTLPLDIWQKRIARKNAKKSILMKDDLEKAKKLCGDNREMMMIKQREINKKYKYNPLAACLPSIVTLVVFMVVLTGFNSAVRFHNYTVFADLTDVYESAYSESINKLLQTDGNEQATVEQSQTATLAAESAVLEAYKPERFLLTINIFMPDTMKLPIPTIKEFTGTSLGDLRIEGIDSNEYSKVMRSIIQKYNVKENGKNAQNGWFVLPILAVVLSLISAKFMKPPEQMAQITQTEEQQQKAKSQAKMMQYLMPIMMGIFPMFYSTAFALYMVISSMITTILNLVYNVYAKRADEREKDIMLSTTLK
ncbi:MAG: YidC/Oxa1 family membrane protein insertase [Christensenellaceae bacterium]|jgi:YidC/Oxa1 family membrane protein insertase|nr:YidC/Oxa1 family membrane protein insertase [Christensenellaceae bacterium]